MNKLTVLFIGLTLIGCGRSTFEVTPAVSQSPTDFQEPRERFEKVQPRPTQTTPQTPSQTQTPSTPKRHVEAEPSAPATPKTQTAPETQSPSFSQNEKAETETAPANPSTPAPAPSLTLPPPVAAAPQAPKKPAPPAPPPAASESPEEEKEDSKITPDTAFEKRPVARDYHASGQPKFTFTSRLQTRVGTQLNRAKPMETLSRKEQEKSKKIFAELRKVTNVAAGVPKRLLFIDKSLATEKSKQFDKDGSISPEGAHTIATEGTARLNGFADRPCAEFVSEVIRQAYQRAEVPLNEDFNVNQRNELHWKETASVAGLRNALLKAGWTAWDLSVFRPMIGAVMMHRTGDTPGHVYLIGADDGLTIVDNGSPNGRDLRKTTLKTIRLMYMGGFFLLPPGFEPAKWPSQKPAPSPGV